MTFGFDQAIGAGAFIGSAIAAVFAGSARRQVKLPHRYSDNGETSRTLGAAMEELSTLQRELTWLLTKHIAEDDAFKDDVRDVLTLKRAGTRRRP